MLWVRTFSVFLPSLTSSSAVWANPSEGQNPRNAANKQTFLIIAIPCRKPQFLICISNPRIVRFSYPRYNEFAHTARPLESHGRPSPEKRSSRNVAQKPVTERTTYHDLSDLRCGGPVRE